MPEFITSLLSAAAPAAIEAGAEAAPGLLSGAAEAAAPAAFGSLGSLAEAGLPFAAGAGELGSVATGLGSAGVSAFGDTAAIGSALAASGLPFAAETAAAGLPAAAGLGQIGSTVGSGVASAIPGAVSGLDSALLPAASTPTSGTGLNFPGLGPGNMSATAFDSAPAVSNWTGEAPIAPAAGGAAGSAPSPISSAAPAAASAADSGGLSDWLKKNAATLGIGGAGIGAALLAPKLAQSVSPKLPNEPQLTANAQTANANAANLTAQEAALTAPLTTGVLPAAQQQQLDNATNDAITSVKSKYASMGLSGSTMELEAINNVKNQSAGLKVNMEAQLAQTGLQMGSQALANMNLTDQIYTSLMNATISQDNNLQSAIAKLAAAAAAGAAASKKAA